MKRILPGGQTDLRQGRAEVLLYSVFFTAEWVGSFHREKPKVTDAERKMDQGNRLRDGTFIHWKKKKKRSEIYLTVILVTTSEICLAPAILLSMVSLSLTLIRSHLIFLCWSRETLKVPYYAFRCFLKIICVSSLSQ